MENIVDLSYIIPPVDKALIKEELKKADFLKKTNFFHRYPIIFQKAGIPSAFKREKFDF